MNTLQIERYKNGRFKTGDRIWARKEKLNFVCSICGMKYSRHESQSIAKRNVCSLKCYWESKKGEKQTQCMTKESIDKISKALKGKRQPWNENEKHHEWKGDNAGYIAFHQWLKRKYGKANKCENPDCVYPRENANGKIMYKPKRHEWSLIHGFEHGHYKERYWQLCKSCHVIYDMQKI